MPISLLPANYYERRVGPPSSHLVDVLGTALARRPDGTLFVTTYDTIRRISPTGTITSVGSLNTSGPAIVTLNALALGGDGTLYVAHTLDASVYRVRPDDASPAFVRIAGTGVQGYAGDGGPAANATLFVPGSLALFGDWLYVGMRSGSPTLRRIDLGTGLIAAVAGTALPAYGDAVPAQQVSLYNTYIATGPDGLYAAAAALASMRPASPGASTQRR